MDLSELSKLNKKKDKAIKDKQLKMKIKLELNDNLSDQELEDLNQEIFEA